jgi:hypothetical protein
MSSSRSCTRTAASPPAACRLALSAWWSSATASARASSRRRPAAYASVYASLRAPRSAAAFSTWEDRSRRSGNGSRASTPRRRPPSRVRHSKCLRGFRSRVGPRYHGQGCNADDAGAVRRRSHDLSTHGYSRGSPSKRSPGRAPNSSVVAVLRILPRQPWEHRGAGARRLNRTHLAPVGVAGDRHHDLRKASAAHDIPIEGPQNPGWVPNVSDVSRSAGSVPPAAGSSCVLHFRPQLFLDPLDNQVGPKPHLVDRAGAPADESRSPPSRTSHRDVTLQAQLIPLYRWPSRTGRPRSKRTVRGGRACIRVDLPTRLDNHSLLGTG